MAEDRPETGERLTGEALRARAEERLRTSRTELSRMPFKEVQALVYELQVHQVELEIQNEELRVASVELADARDRFADLYEFAPVGYLTLDQEDHILRANLNAARMLEAERGRLVGAKLTDFVARDGQDDWHLHREAVFSEPATQTCELPMRTGQGRRRWFRLESSACSSDAANDTCHMAVTDVTDRRQAEAAQRESEQRFRVMADGVPLIIWVHGVDGRQEFVNRTFCEFFGVRPEDLEGGHWQTFVHPDDFQSYAGKFGRCTRERRPFHAETRARRADGEWRWLESWATPRFSPSGEFLGMVGTSLDITQRKMADDQIRRSNAELEREVARRTSALVMLNDVASVSNQSTNVHSAMSHALKRVCQHNGWLVGHAWLPAPEDPEKLLAEHVWYGEAGPSFDALREAVSGLRIRAAEGLVGRVFRHGIPEISTDVGQALSNHTAPVAASLGIRTAAGFPILAGEALVGVLEFYSKELIENSQQMLSTLESVGMLLGSVVERDRVARALRASEERHRSVLDAAPDAIIAVLRADGKITDANPATERIFGYSVEELIGENVKVLMPAPYREEHDEYLTGYQSTGEPRIIGRAREIFGQRRDGTVFPIELEINEVDHLGLFVGIIRDITERKTLERQVVDAASEEQRRIGQDIHDGVGQELTGLRYMAQTHAETLAERNSPDTPVAERLSQWLENVQRQLRAIIRELVPVEIDQLGLAAALRGLAERTAENCDIACRFECSRPIVVADSMLATHLYRIVQEAVGNAVRHAEATRITIEVSQDAAALKVRVVDNGTGIRLRSPESSGIGLRTMAYRAGLIGGVLAVDRAEPRGTVVKCTVPRRPSRHAPTGS